MVFDVRYTETNIGWFQVEADSPAQAEARFWDGVATGEYDLLKTQIVESDVTAFEMD